MCPVECHWLCENGQCTTSSFINKLISFSQIYVFRGHYIDSEKDKLAMNDFWYNP